MAERMTWRLAIKDPKWRWSLTPGGDPWEVKMLASLIHRIEGVADTFPYEFVHASDDGNFYLPGTEPQEKSK